MKVSIVIFTLNEITGMKAIMPRIKREWYDEMIIVDGGSTDGTIEYARAQGYTIFNQKEKGIPAAIIEGMQKSAGDVIVLFTPDGNSIPERIPDLVKKMKEGYDIVIVSRYLDGAKSYDDDVITSFGNKVLTGLINLLFRAGITDAVVIFRAFRKEVVRSLGCEKKAIAWPTKLLLRAVKRNLRVGEIPGDEPRRIGGVRKLRPLRDGMCELTMILKEFFIR